ncbi:condensation domain-containing protein [Streptomyces sp. NPDC005574]|uniref:condensation domain-containing protein n=1 Tax=Streptomyces sp. NPDC005574 TaxID=3156891 RepID=UPI0033BF3CBA
MSGQVGLWYGAQLAPDGSVYHEGEYLEIGGALDQDLFLKALKRAMAEAEAYRLRLRVEGGKPYQYVDDSQDRPIHVADLGDEPDPLSAARAWMDADLRGPVEIVDRPLTAHALFRLGPDHFVWYQRAHHIAVDGASFAVFSEQVARIYTKLRNGTDADHEALVR